MDSATLQACTGCTTSNAAMWLDPITSAMSMRGIDSPTRMAAFLAQVSHESGRLVYTSEIWGPTAAQLGYEGRADLGNTQLGDGSLFRGRGLIQITGRSNYNAVGAALCLDCINQPQMLAEPEWAAQSAAWWWTQHGCNDFADSGDFEGLTRRINGGLNGLADRLALWQSAKQALGVAP